MTAVETKDCPVCNHPDALSVVTQARNEGHGYKEAWNRLKKAGIIVARDDVQAHCQHQARDVMSAIGDSEDNATQTVDEEWFKARGIVVPEGVKWVAATVTERNTEGDQVWLRVKPEDDDEVDRVEIRQAQPVVISPAPVFMPHVFVPGNWQTWIVSPDAQVGYWFHTSGRWITTHDERCFDIGHQIGWAVNQDEGLHGWGDVGDLMDQQGISRHDPTIRDLMVHGFNLSNQRVCQEWATRRMLVGEDGELFVTEGNHDLRWRSKFGKDFPMLVGLKRAGDPDDEHPVLTVPYLTRAKDYGVEWCPSYPTGYRRLNSNLAVFHCPLYGSKALDTSRKLAARIKMSVVFGHTHRRESMAENFETSEGNRTLEIWSDGTWGRTDGALPSERNTFDDDGNRLIAGELPNPKWGMLSENFHQGLSVVHVETDGRERFSVERVAIWDGWALFRGVTFQAGVDANGDPVERAA